MEVDVCIIGGGISGLTAALALVRQGKRVFVLEQAHTVGGVLQSTSCAGFTFDAGANTLRVSEAEVRDFIASVVPAEMMRLANPATNKRYILHNGTLHPLKPHPISLLTSPLLSFKARLHLLAEPFTKPNFRTDTASNVFADESLAAFVERRLGREIVEKILNPFVTGIYGTSPENLSVYETFPLLKRLEMQYGSLAKGAWKERKTLFARTTPPSVMTFIGGMQTFARRIAELLGDAVRTQTEVYAVQRSDDKERGRWCVSTSNGTIFCKHCIITTEAPAAAQILASLEKSTSRELSSIEYGKITLVHLGYKQALVSHPLDSFGFLIPESEGEPFLGALWNSAFFPHTAPPEHAAFTLFVGEETTRLLEHDDPNREHDISIQHPRLKPVVARFQEIMQIQGEPCVSNVRLWKRAIPRYAVGYGQFDAVWKSFEERNAGLHLLGSYRGGVSLQDCMKNALKTASELTFGQTADILQPS
jgi:oxygen-dependent protoporphyrinogen oxidase